jgi:hypothetical protein
LSFRSAAVLSFRSAAKESAFASTLVIPQRSEGIRFRIGLSFRTLSLPKGKDLLSF